MYAFNHCNLGEKKRFLLYYLFFIILFFPSSLLASEGKHYIEVLEKKNSVISKVPGYPNWTYVKKGAKLPFGTLLQIGKKSSVTLRYPMELVKKYIGMEYNDFILKNSMIVRLEMDLIRSMKIDQRFMDMTALKSLVDKGKIGDGEIVKYVFPDASKRNALIAYFGEQEKMFHTKIENSRVLEESSFLSKAIYKKINIIFPKDNALFSGIGFPITVNLYWEKIKKAAPYKLYVWKMGKQRSQYTLYNTNYTTLSIKKQGTYNVQVTSQDGTYQSKVIRFKAFDYGYITKLGYFGYGEDTQKVEKPVMLTYPKKEVVFVKKKDEKMTRLCWESSEFIPGQKFNVQVYRGTNEEAFRAKEVLESCVEFDLPVGKYTWLVTTNILVEKKIVETTKPETSNEDNELAKKTSKPKKELVSFSTKKIGFEIIHENEFFTFFNNEISNKIQDRSSRLILE